MPIRPPEFDAVAMRLVPQLENLPGKLVAIDGRMNAGKTTLARFLAWYFNISLVETDPFLLGDGTLRRRTDIIDLIIRFRLDRDRPVLVEGVGILDLLAQLGRRADARVYVVNTSNDVEPIAAVLEYEQRFPPSDREDIVVSFAHGG